MRLRVPGRDAFLRAGALQRQRGCAIPFRAPGRGQETPMGRSVEVYSTPSFIPEMQRPSTMIPPPEARSQRTMPETAPGGESAQTALTRIRPLVRPGHVFAIDDAVTGRTNAGKRNRPNVLVIVPPLHDRDEMALQQNVAVSARLSWKEEWGTPGSHAASEVLARRKWVYSPRYSLKAFNKGGIFELDERRTVRIADLLHCEPLGWLPQPAIDAIMAHAGARLCEPYPPVDR